LGVSILTVVKVLSDLWSHNAAHAGIHWHMLALGCGGAVRLRGRSLVLRAVVSRGRFPLWGFLERRRRLEHQIVFHFAEGNPFALGLGTRSDLVPPLVHAWHGDRAGSDCPCLLGVIYCRFTSLLTSRKPLKKGVVVGRPLGAEDQSLNGIFSTAIWHFDDACVWSVTQVSFLTVKAETACTELSHWYCALGFGWQRGVTFHGACMHSQVNPATPCHPGMHLLLSSLAVPVTARNRRC
jgi:hypothetical protein